MQVPPKEPRDARHELLLQLLERKARFPLVQVVAALHGMHDAGLAHLDVRVPNVGFTHNAGQLEAIFIDPDRCRLIVSVDSDYLQLTYGDAADYKTGVLDPAHALADVDVPVLETWSSVQQDFRQLGFCLAGAMGLPRRRLSHSSSISEIEDACGHDPFVMALYCYGVVMPELRNWPTRASRLIWRNGKVIQQ